MTAGPASEIADAVPSSKPVPIEPPTATMVICPAVSSRWRPDSGLGWPGIGAFYWYHRVWEKEGCVEARSKCWRYRFALLGTGGGCGRRILFGEVFFPQLGGGVGLD